MVSASHPADYPLMVADCMARLNRLNADEQELVRMFFLMHQEECPFNASDKATIDDIWERATARG